MFTKCELDIGYFQEIREYLPKGMMSSIFYGLLCTIDGGINFLENFIFDTLDFQYQHNIPSFSWIVLGMILISILIAKDVAYWIYHGKFRIYLFWLFSFCYNVRFIAFGLLKSDSLFSFIIAWVVSCFMLALIDNAIDDDSMDNWEIAMLQKIENQEYHPRKHGLNLRS